MTGLAIARALHVLAIVVWVGGVAMVTTIVLPAIRRGRFGSDRWQSFQAIEGRFAWQARIATIVVALTGFYMVAKLDAWDRFRSIDFWWMHAMVGVWLLFTLILFVAEPLVLHRTFHAKVRADPEAAFTMLNRIHWVLLGITLVTILGAVAGSQGISFSTLLTG